MNPRMLPRFMALIGKLANEFKFMDDPEEAKLFLTPDEIELVRMSLVEYKFYHAHELREAGQEPSTNIDDIQKQGINQAIPRAKLSLKTTR